MNGDELERSPGAGSEGWDNLLELASQRHLRLPDLLQYVLRQALCLTSSDVAACVLELPDLGASQPEVRVFAAHRGSAGLSAGTSLYRWAANRCQDRRARRTTKALRLDRLERDRSGIRLEIASHSGVLMPLVDQRHSLGFLQIESSQPRHYSAAHLERLMTLATEVVPAIYRLVLREYLQEAGSDMDLVGMSPAARKLDRQLLHAAHYDRGAPVLITGERGSGKEVAAWAIHCWSPRRQHPFVPVLLSAIPDNLVADELFGHERHAFTGADNKRSGKLEAAAKGTVFLDEIGDVSLPLQASLLRIVERKEVSRIGRDLPLRIDARIVAATNSDLERAIMKGKFRADLYDRLTMFEIKIPPLRERREDIPLLAAYYLNYYCSEFERWTEMGHRRLCKSCRQPRSTTCASADFYEALKSYDWPGNVRELKQMMLHILVTVTDKTIEGRHLPDHLRNHASAGDDEVSGEWNLDAAIRRHITAVLDMTNHNKSKAARLLGIPYTTLQSKLKKLGLRSG